MKVNEILTYYYGVCALVFQILHILEGEWDLSLSSLPSHVTALN
jgi:hypothetical protein